MSTPGEWYAVYNDDGDIIVTNGRKVWGKWGVYDGIDTFTLHSQTADASLAVKFVTRFMAKRRARILNRDAATARKRNAKREQMAKRAGERV